MTASRGKRADLASSDLTALAAYFSSHWLHSPQTAPAEAERCLQASICSGASRADTDKFIVRLATLIGRDPIRRPEALDLVEPVVERNASPSYELLIGCLMLASDEPRRPKALYELGRVCMEYAGRFCLPVAMMARAQSERPVTTAEARSHLKTVGWFMDRTPDAAFDSIHAVAASRLCGDLTNRLGSPRLAELTNCTLSVETIDAALICYIHEIQPYAPQCLAILRRCTASAMRPWFLAYEPHIEARPDHPAHERLPALAAVCRGDADPRSLAGWKEWADAQ